MKNILVCPVCGKVLDKNEKSFVCDGKHSFDISSKGYVNLLLSSHTNSKIPGDNKMMVMSRRDFLDKGYYRVLHEKLNETFIRYFPADGGVLLDAGCGEGYYTSGMADAAAKKNIRSDIIAADISKYACGYAAKRLNAYRSETLNISVITASVFRLPAADGSVNVLTSLFAPFCREEFLRVLVPGGILIMVIPSADHLYSLKSAVYDRPYLNEKSDTEIDGFKLIEELTADDDIHLGSHEDIENLFSMTPYFYKTSREGHERLEKLTELDTHIGFNILVYGRR